MKIQFVHTGDVHSLVMAMMQGQSFTLTSERKSLEVQPNLKKEGFSVKSVNSEMVMTLPVTLPELDGEATMTFQYNVEMVVVAEAVAPVQEVVGRPYVAGVSCKSEGYIEQTSDGVRFWGDDIPDIKMVEEGGTTNKHSTMVGAKFFESVAHRPAIEGRPAVKVALFQRSRREHRSMTIKFE